MAVSVFFVYLPILNGLDVNNRRKELMAIVKRAVAALKEYDYEVVIDEYTERYGL